MRPDALSNSMNPNLIPSFLAPTTDAWPTTASKSLRAVLAFAALLRGSVEPQNEGPRIVQVWWYMYIYTVSMHTLGKYRQMDYTLMIRLVKEGTRKHIFLEQNSGQRLTPSRNRSSPSWTLLSLIFSQSSFQALAEVPVDVAPGRSEWLRSSMGMTYLMVIFSKPFFPRGLPTTVIGQLLTF